MTSPNTPVDVEAVRRWAEVALDMIAKPGKTLATEADIPALQAVLRLLAERREMLEALKAIADESIFSQQRFAEDDDADYFLRCFKAIKERARRAIPSASTGKGE